VTTPVTGLPDWLSDPGLRPLWAASADGLERRSLEPRGRIVLSDLDRASRHAVAGLLGQPVVRDRVPVDLTDLDRMLRERSGVGGLRTVCERALGHRLTDRAARRSAAVTAREAPLLAARDWLDRHPDLATAEWPQEWLSWLRRTGTASRLAEPVRAVTTALDVVADVVGGGAASRAELAVRHTGDAHALDAGSPLAGLVLRALAYAHEVPPPTTASERRALWERHGVHVDSVSATCLTLGLPGIGDSGLAHRLRSAADSGDPVHLTAWDLARSTLSVPSCTPVLVCENPQVLEAMARRCAARWPIVCSAGEPNGVAIQLLRQLATSDARLWYHGDFDWPGIAIANRIRAIVGAEPWLMSASDYRAAARSDGLPLTGPPVTPTWDQALGSAMRDAGVAVHEESVLDALLDRAPELGAEA
jgi:uncharacterized protein (TIGR02679 family)